MRAQIVETADKIREILDSDESVEVQQLIEDLSESPELVYSALGWLARGNEIVYCTISSRIVVSSANTYHEFLW